MPLNLDSSETVSQVIDTLEINSFSVDLERLELHVVYDKGHMLDGSFVPDIKDILLTIDGADFFPAIAGSDVYANAMTAGSISVYSALKMALYDEIKKDTLLTGTVA